MRVMAILVLALSIVGGAAAAAAPEPLQRATDRQVQRLIDAVARDTSAFRRALPSDLKKSVVQGSRGEVAVENYLDDLDEDIKKLKQRFKPDYSAAADVADLLRRAGPLHEFVRARPAMKGANEWDVVAADLTQLARDYGASFPLNSDAVVSRIGDRELQTAAKTIADSASSTTRSVKSAIKKVPQLAAAGAAVLVDLDDLARAAKSLGSLVKGKKPATAEARVVDGLCRNVGSFVAQQASVMPTVASAWTPAPPACETIARGFGLTAAARAETATAH